MKVIHHNEVFDVEAFFSTIKSSYIGMDYHDYEIFATKGGELHTFIGSSEGDERVREAVDAAIGSDEVKVIIPKASAAIMVILGSKNSDRPLAMSQMQQIFKIFDRFSPNCDVTWRVIDDEALGDSIKVVFVINV